MWAQPTMGLATHVRAARENGRVSEEAFVVLQFAQLWKRRASVHGPVLIPFLSTLVRLCLEFFRMCIQVSQGTKGRFVVGISSQSAPASASVFPVTNIVEFFHMLENIEFVSELDFS